MQAYRVMCSVCGYSWLSQWDHYLFGWKFECPKCGARDGDIANMGGARTTEPRNYTHKSGRKHESTLSKMREVCE